MMVKEKNHVSLGFTIGNHVVQEVFQQSVHLFSYSTVVLLVCIMDELGEIFMVSTDLISLPFDSCLNAEI